MFNPPHSRSGSNSSNTPTERYQRLSILGEGSQGRVFKCRMVETGTVVAVKRYHDLEDENIILKKMAYREIRSLKNFRHPNLLQMLEVFRRRGRLHLVLEFCDTTLLEVIQKYPKGVSLNFTKEVIWQMLQGLNYCHMRNCVHRDIKPENILLTRENVVKLSDFAFAKFFAPGDKMTDYVATRWYRAPEIIVGDPHYGPNVDIWALGCVLAELAKGQPLWPGSSDFDQLYLICNTLGELPPRQLSYFQQNEFMKGLRIPDVTSLDTIETKVPVENLTATGMDFLKKCLDKDSDSRPSCDELLTHPFVSNVHFKYPLEKNLDRISKASPSFPRLPTNTNQSPNSRTHGVMSRSHLPLIN